MRKSRERNLRERVNNMSKNRAHTWHRQGRVRRGWSGSGGLLRVGWVRSLVSKGISFSVSADYSFVCLKISLFSPSFKL